jgi:hypothetical protein
LTEKGTHITQVTHWMELPNLNETYGGNKWN